MSNSIKIQVTNTLEGKLKELEEQIEDDKRQVVQDRAVTALKYSFPFVDTGAYMTSWSVSTGRGRPRGKSSRGRPKMSANAAFQESFKNIQSDVAKLDMSKEEFTLRNGAPHEPYVEKKHKVFARLRGGS